MKTLPRIMLAALPLLAGTAWAEESVIITTPVPAPMAGRVIIPEGERERAQIKQEIRERAHLIHALRSEIQQRMMRLSPEERLALHQELSPRRVLRPGFVPAGNPPPYGYGRGFEERNPR